MSDSDDSQKPNAASKKRQHTLTSSASGSGSPPREPPPLSTSFSPDPDDEPNPQNTPETKIESEKVSETDLPSEESRQDRLNRMMALDATRWQLDLEEDIKYINSRRLTLFWRRVLPVVAISLYSLWVICAMFILARVVPLMIIHEQQKELSNPVLTVTLALIISVSVSTTILMTYMMGYFFPRKRKRKQPEELAQEQAYNHLDRISGIIKKISKK